MRRYSIIALVIVLFSCGGETVDTSTTTSTTSSSTTTSTTTTTMPTTTTTTVPTISAPPSEFSSPVSGLTPEIESKLDRRAISVKIDNEPDARPQSEIDQADAVIELLYRLPGFTRWIAVFHTGDSHYLGPVRSVRPTDSAILPAIPSVIAASGEQPWVRRLANSRGTVIFESGEAAMFRVSDRSAPHNLFVDTDAVRLTADAEGIPDERPTWIYEIGDWIIPEAPATRLDLAWSETQVVSWHYDKSTEAYTRWNGDEPHNKVGVDGTTSQISAQVLVIIFGEQYTEWPPASAEDGSIAVPATRVNGSGVAWVVAKGAIWTGTWERPDDPSDYAAPFTLLNLDGTPAVVPPGVSWISIFPDDRSITVS